MTNCGKMSHLPVLTIPSTIVMAYLFIAGWTIYREFRRYQLRRRQELWRFAMVNNKQCGEVCFQLSDFHRPEANDFQI